MRRISRTIFRLRRKERGQTIVETALCMTILLVAIFSIIDFTRALFVYHFVSYAAQQGSRYAMVRGADWSDTPNCTTTTMVDCRANTNEIKAYILTLVPPGLKSSNVAVSSSFPGGTPTTPSASQCTGSNSSQSAGCLVKVQVTYSNFTFMMPFLPHPSGGYSFTSLSEQAIEW